MSRHRGFELVAIERKLRNMNSIIFVFIFDQRRGTAACVWVDQHPTLTHQTNVPFLNLSSESPRRHGFHQQCTSRPHGRSPPPLCDYSMHSCIPRLWAGVNRQILSALTCSVCWECGPRLQVAPAHIVTLTSRADHLLYLMRMRTHQCMLSCREWLLNNMMLEWDQKLRSKGKPSSHGVKLESSKSPHVLHKFQFPRQKLWGESHFI